jgi:hypothetical protein
MSYGNSAELALHQPPIMDCIMNHLYNSDSKVSMLNLLQVFNSKKDVSHVIHHYIDKQKRHKLEEIRTDLLFAKTMHKLFNAIDDVDELNLTEEELSNEITRCTFTFLNYAVQNKEKILSSRHDSFKHPCYWAIVDLASTGALDEERKKEYIETLGLDGFELWKL